MDLAELFLSEIEGKEEPTKLELTRILEKIEYEYLSNHRFSNAGNFYTVLSKGIDPFSIIQYTELHDQMLAFWDVYKEFDDPIFRKFSIVRMCGKIIIHDDLIQNSKDKNFVIAELINNFTGRQGTLVQIKKE